MATLTNVFALLADNESENVSTIAGLDDTDLKPKNTKENNKKNKSGKGKEGNHGHGQRSLGDNVVEQSYNDHQHNRRSNGYVNGSVNRQSYNGHQHNGRSNGYVNGSGHLRYGPVDKPVYKRFWQVKGNAGDANGSVLHNGPSDGLLKDGVNVTSRHSENYRPHNRRARVTEIGPDQEFENDVVIASSGGNEVMIASDGGNPKQEADNSPVAEEVKGSHGDNQKHKAVDSHDNESQEKVSAETEVLSKEELRERTRLAKEQAEKKAKWLARQEEIKREMAMKTLKEYEELKAIEKRKKAEKSTLSVPQAQALDKDLESMLVLSKEKKDDIYKKQKWKNETAKKDVNIVKDAKVHKTMSIDEFMELPTGSEGQDGPGSDRSEDSIKNTNGGGRGRGGVVFRNYKNSNQGGGRGRGRVFRNYENSNQGGGRGSGGVSTNYGNSNQGGGRARGGNSRNYEYSNHGETRRDRSNNSRDSGNNENDNRGGIGRGRVHTRNRAPDLSETSIFPVLGEAIKSRKDLREHRV